MKTFRERSEQRINRDVENQANWVVRSVQNQIDAGKESPFNSYAYVKGLSPEQTAQLVGQMATRMLGEQYMLDAQLAEEESSIVRQGAIIRVLQVGPDAV